jgi:uncharacterized cupredoxin-like copper-binding protein
MRTSRPLGILALVAALPFAIGACTPAASATPTPPAAASPASAATTVEVKLQEWAVGTDVNTAPPGAVTFAVSNIGPEDVHEFVVIKTDLSLIALPTDANGAVNEEGGGVEVIGEIEDVAVGASEELTVTLAPGAYVLICNIYDDTEKEAHYQQGMRTSFTVK